MSRWRTWIVAPSLHRRTFRQGAAGAVVPAIVTVWLYRGRAERPASGQLPVSL